MRRMLRSLGYSLEGLAHAVRRERNIRFFLAGYFVVLCLGAYVSLRSWEWVAIVLSGGLFLSVELLNTSFERLTDAFDHARKLQGDTGLQEGLKWTKDVSSAAALVALVVNVAVILIVLVPYFLPLR